MITPEKIIQKVKALGFELRASEGNLKLERPAGSTLPPELATAIKETKQELLMHLTHQTKKLIHCGHTDFNAWRLDQDGGKWICGICHPPGRDDVIFAGGCVIAYSNGVRVIPGSLTWEQAGELLEKARRESRKEAMAI